MSSLLSCKQTFCWCIWETITNSYYPKWFCSGFFYVLIYCVTVDQIIIFNVKQVSLASAHLNISVPLFYQKWGKSQAWNLSESRKCESECSLDITAMSQLCFWLVLCHWDCIVRELCLDIEADQTESSALLDGEPCHCICLNAWVVGTERRISIKLILTYYLLLLILHLIKNYIFFSVITELNILRIAGKRKHRNADTFRSVAKLITAIYHICSAMLTFNSAKPTVNTVVTFSQI